MFKVLSSAGKTVGAYRTKKEALCDAARLRAQGIFCWVVNRAGKVVG
jgi:hypothetical protein